MDNYGSQMHKVSLVLLMILYLQGRECFSINLEGRALLKFRSKVDVDSYGALKSWNLVDSDPCKWTGVRCVDGSAEYLFLYENNFSGVIPSGFDKVTMLELLDLRCNKLKRAFTAKTEEMSALKHLFKFTCKSSLEDLPDSHEINLSSFLTPCGDDNMQSCMHLYRRKLLLETSNLPASRLTGVLPRVAVPVPSMGSGSFPAVPNAVDVNLRKQSSEFLQPKSALPGYVAANQPFVLDPIGHIGNETTITSEKSANWIYVISLLAALFACTAIINLIAHFRQGGAAVSPWKTGLSGLLRKALISGVTKLNRLEMEVACEDFSNIINTYPECIIFKGTLSSGSEIAVVSTLISSSRDWSRNAEMRFRKKIDTLSKINHKNFVNLLGYCSEDSPFMRMMAYEYAPNGTLFEHLHVKDYEHIDWAGRMRIVMGIAYCLQFMHHELCPPFPMSELRSSSIYLTDDYAAKICDTTIWKEIATQGSKSVNNGVGSSETPDICFESNVYNFGILLLEIISGKLSYSEEHGSILYWATEFLHDKQKIKILVDKSLKSIKNNELEAICEVIQECVHHDPKDRPTMKEVASRLRDSLGITPDVATPRLSPLWWAELEILSVEAN